MFERVFKAYGLPCAIRSDNGLPFSAPTGLFGLSRLSVWWLRLGIGIERIAPGKPQQNGRHERLHLTLKQEATQPVDYNFLQQQAKFDKFIEVYNHERPHQGLAMQYPGQVYTPSTRIYEGLPEVEYPFHDRTVEVTRCGRICYRKKKIHISQSLSGQKLGIREVEDKVWLVSFMHYDIGYFDEQSARFEPLADPFGTKVLPISSV